MSLRLGYGMLFAVVLMVQSGCYCCSSCWPNGRIWCGPSCGPVYWNEWFSHPPECHDPCDRCANYTGPSGRALYYPGYVPSSMSGGQANTDYYAPDETMTGDGSPELADPQSGEDLPPGRPSAMRYANEFGETVSYREPVDSPRRSRKLGGSRRPVDYGW